MADAEIRVKTIVDLKAIQNAQNKIDKINKDLEKATEKAEKAEKGVGYDKTPAGDRRRQRDIENATYAIEQLQDELEEAKADLDNLFSSGKKMSMIERVQEAQKALENAEKEYQKWLDLNEKALTSTDSYIETDGQVYFGDDAIEVSGNKAEEARKKVEDATKAVEELQEALHQNMSEEIEKVADASDRVAQSAQSASDSMYEEETEEENTNANEQDMMLSLGGLFNQLKGLAVVTITIKAFEKIGSAFKGLTSFIFKTVSAVVSGVFSMLSKSVEALASTIKSAVSIVVQYTKEGLDNFIIYSTEYNKIMSDLRATMIQLKNNLASAFSPIIELVVPYLTQLVSWVNVAVEQVSKFMAVLSGRNTYTRAKKQMSDIARSMKQSQQQLASFDKLNVIGQTSTDGRPEDMFETVSLDGDTSKVVAFAQTVRDVFEQVWAKFAEVIEPMKEILATLLEPLKTVFEWLWVEILSPLGEWFMNLDFNAILERTLEIITQLGEIWDEISPTLKDLWENTVKPALAEIGIVLGEEAGGWIDEILEQLEGFATWVVDNKELIRKTIENIKKWVIKLIEIVKPLISQTFSLIKDELTVGMIAFEHFTEFVSAIFSGSFEDIWANFSALINDLMWTLQRFASNVVSFFENIGVNIPDWIKNITTQDDKNYEYYKWLNGASSSYSYVPQLADGAVIPPNNRFLAMLGDQTAGTNIETPLSTMVEAFNTALQNGGYNNNNDIVVQIDGKEVFRAVQKQNNSFIRATGRGAF